METLEEEEEWEEEEGEEDIRGGNESRELETGRGVGSRIIKVGMYHCTKIQE